MEEDEEFVEETWTRYCELCEQWSTFSESNPYGTCQCS
jgi:hypothetical protein